ncbi:MAG: hypothetical protein LC130_13885 [Bryobacterales bacterium]|nr:hypothetical protein [Steroidobacteraceae bacterium]MCZ2076076.1 hypothetical protein [Bryobacterales bacterium]MEB2361876.1 hypothetical protein [Bryobacterales bacterium]
MADNTRFAVEARSLGKVAVAVPGSPVRVTVDENLRAVRMRFAPLIGETGRMFLGVAGMNKGTGAGVIKEFWPTGVGGGVADELVLEAAHGLRPADYWIDANVAGEGLLVAYWVPTPYWAP